MIQLFNQFFLLQFLASDFLDFGSVSSLKSFLNSILLFLLFLFIIFYFLIFIDYCTNLVWYQIFIKELISFAFHRQKIIRIPCSSNCTVFCVLLILFLRK